MSNEIYEAVKEIFDLLIDSTKTNVAQWINIKAVMQNVEMSPLVNQFQQEQLLDSLVMCPEKSNYVKINNTYFLCFCFKNIVSNEIIYKVIMINGQPLKVLDLSQYDEKNYSSRLANIIRFQSIDLKDIKTEEDLAFIKSIISEFLNSW